MPRDKGTKRTRKEGCNTVIRPIEADSRGPEFSVIEKVAPGSSAKDRPETWPYQKVCIFRSHAL